MNRCPPKVGALLGHNQGREKCFTCGNVIGNSYVCCDNNCGAIYCSDVCFNDKHECLVEDDSVDIPDDAVM
jgi:hypothetical protein